MSFSERESENIPKKGGMFGFRKRNKIKKTKNIPQLIAHILNIPNDKIVVLDKKEAEKRDKEKRDKESTDKFNQSLKEMNESSDESNIDDSTTDSSGGPSNTSETTAPETSNSSETSGEGNDTSQKTTSKGSPIISSYNFDPSVGQEEQTKIKDLIGSLNNMLRLPELGLFGDDEIEGKTDSVVMIEKIIDDDGEKQNPPKEIYMEPLIQIIE